MNPADDLTITFLGGADEIGASSAVVRAGGTSVLVDCGVRFRSGSALPDLDALSGKRLDAILVTHAHTDHTGGLPVVHEAFPTVPIFLTPPTLDLVRILQRDALRLMTMGWEREGEVPLYHEAAVESMLHVVRAVPLAQSFSIGAFEVTFLPASHILGAAMVHVATPAGSVLFTGDYSVEAQRTVPALDPPALAADVVVTESTYGNRLHADRKAAERRLVTRVAETLTGEGRVLIPAFAIGRAQEVLLILRRAQETGDLPDVPVFVDGMVRAVAEVYPRHPLFATNALAKKMRGGHPFYTDRIQPVAAPEERRQVLEAGPAVIVASSGMLSGGPSAFYAGELAPNDRDAVLITGYQDEESPGRALLGLAVAEGPRTLRLGDREVPVRCSFDTYGLSAHADRMQMAGLLEGLRPATVVLVHGDAGAKRNLAGALTCRDVVLAGNGEQVMRGGSRRRPGRPPPRTEIHLEAGQARHLVAGAPGGLLKVDRVARDFFGRKAPAVLVERLVRRLEELGVAARDDRRRGLLRVWAGDPDDDPRAQELRDANPKGRLIEYCMRRGVEPPEFEVREAPGGRRRVTAHLVIDGETLTGDLGESGSARVAEQLAAESLLAKIAAGEDTAEAVSVDEEEGERLKSENPKGRLLEHCAAERRPAPRLELRPLSAGDFLGRASIDAGGGEQWETRAYRAAAARTAEQAAARELLEELRRRGPEPQVAAGPDGEDGRLVLNRYRQTEQIREFGYESVATGGPAHRPEFKVVAYAMQRDGSRVESGPVSAGSKKEAQRLAADALVARLRDGDGRDEP